MLLHNRIEAIIEIGILFQPDARSILSKMNTKNASKSIAYGQRRARAQRTFTYERMDNKTLELVRALSCIRSNQYDEVMKKLTKQASTHKPNGYSS